MAGLGDCVKRHFPLRSAQDVMALFGSQLTSNDEPNLALLSIVAGCIENLLTCKNGQPPSELTFPIVNFSTIEELYNKFKSLIKSSVDLTVYRSPRCATRELVKKVSDVIWGSLTRSYYKDRAHLQSLYSYLTGNKLDCFGVAFAVVAAFQVIGYKDVHLALSEDHAWVIYGENQEDTAEVTWHGKGNEDKRGQSVSAGTREKSWLYLNGFAVQCTRHMEVAALVSGINPSINATIDSNRLAILQQQLLWLLYDLNHLKMYPMALGNLGDLEEISSTLSRPPPIEIFRESILSSKSFYNNQHVYPYTYLGGYLYRNGHYKGALESWANAADVIRKYNYGREDEEIYKEFLEIANELIPHILRVINASEAAEETANLFFQDPEVYIQILRFIDGLCEWEEESSTPVLHIGWVKPLVCTLVKFPSKTRSRVKITSPLVKTGDDDEQPSFSSSSSEISNPEGFKTSDADASALNGSSHKDSTKSVSSSNESKSEEDKKPAGQESEFLRTLETQIDPEDKPHPNIAALAAACGDNILNPDYFFGSDEPFSSDSATTGEAKTPLANSNGISTILKSDSSKRLLQCDNKKEENDSTISVLLTSQKMRGLKELVLAKKMNTSAIQLQLTAQSQVQVVRRSSSTSQSECDRSGKRAAKRPRRV